MQIDGAVKYKTVEEALADGKTQTEVDEYLANAWEPPSVRPEAVGLKDFLKKLEDQLYETKSWTPEHEKQVEDAIGRARDYLDRVKVEAQKEIRTLKLVREKLEKKYVGAYAAISKVLSDDDSAWPGLLELGQKMVQEEVRSFCQSVNGILLMYAHATQVKPTFDQIFQGIALGCNATFLPARL